MNEAELRGQLEQHYMAGYGWALSCCGYKTMDAEEVLQTVYLKILEGRARYDGRAQFRTWLFAVIRHTAIDHRRRGWLARLRLNGYRYVREPSAQAVNSKDLLEEMEILKAFQEALTRLSSRQREVLHLVFYQELSVQEASEVLGITVGAARRHYDRGKRRLREWLTQQEPSNAT